MPQLVKNIASSYCVQFAGIISGIFLFPFVVGQVGLTQYGLLLLINSINGFFALDFGMGMSTLRYVAQARAQDDVEKLSGVVSTSIVFFAGLGAVATLTFGSFLWLSWGGLNIPAGETRLAVQLAVVSGVSTFLFGLPLGVFRTVLAGLRRHDLSNLLAIGVIACRVTATVVLLTAGFGILAIAIADLALTLIAGTLTIAVCRRFLPGLRISWRRFSFPLLRSMTPYSLQVFLMTASGLVVMQADNYIIGISLPLASVTLYAAGFRLYQTCRNLMAALIGPLVPEAAHSSTLNQHDRLRSLLVRGTAHANAISLVTGVPTAFFAEPILVAWAGPEFAGVAVVAQILVVGLLINHNHVLASSLLTGIGRIGAFVRYHLLWAAANIVLSVFLIQRIGLPGLALGTTIPIVLLEPFYTRTALRELDVPLRAYLGEAVLRPFALALMALVPVGLARLALDRVGIVDALVLSGCFALIFLALFFRFGLTHAERSLYLGWITSAHRGLSRGRV